MAILVSPGVDVQIIDESFYNSAGPGTVPLVFVATATNKTAASGGTAAYTAPEKAGELYLATSQRDLIQNYGTPIFKSVQGTIVQGDELNEYGLHTAYQFLGISNRCFVLRANIDLNQLEASSSAPVGNPLPGTYWFDLSETSFGLFQSNGNPNAGLSWGSRQLIIAAEGSVVDTGSTDEPSPSIGNTGDFAVVVTMSDNLIYEKIVGTWYAIGTAEWKAQRPTTVTGRANPNNVVTTNVISINGTNIAFDVDLATSDPGTGALVEVVNNINAAAIPNLTASVEGTALKIVNSAGEDFTILDVTGTALTTLGIVPGLKPGVAVYRTPTTGSSPDGNASSYPANSAAGSLWIKGSVPNRGANWKIKFWSDVSGWLTVVAPMYVFDSMLNDGDATKDTAAFGVFGTPTTGTIYVGFDPANGTQQLRRWSGVRWENLIYEAGTVPPVTAPVEDTMWFNANFRADIMYGDGSQWVGYKRKYADTDPNGVLITGSAPLYQSDGTALVDNDLWIDSSDLENYPALYRYDSVTARWNLIDKTDQTTPFGIVFADARQNSGTNYTNNPNNGTYNYNVETAPDMLLSNFVDPDAPDARTHPDGVLLFNTRYSTYNVKQWKPTYFQSGGFDDTDYTMNTYDNSGSTAVFPAITAGRWVTASGNTSEGAPFMGRKAQRVMIVRALAEVIGSNEDIRSEIFNYNLIAAPGYAELMEEMVALNIEKKEIALVVGDTPIRLKPTGTEITNWAQNAKNVPSTGEEGLTVSNEYVAVYYPWGLGTDLNGNEVMVPPSTIALNTIAYNDAVSYPWFAPAGERRGLVTNASSVGYLTSEGEFKPVILNPGQRDVLYSNKINPIAYIPGRGLVVYGQKTLSGVSSALDRINVARLANYLKFNLDNLVKPFLFEQNDDQTRDAAQSTVESFLNGLIGLRALQDYAVLCDETNNTPERRDRNELWIDVAIQPLHAIEFIYIPVRILNSGADLTTAIPTTF